MAADSQSLHFAGSMILMNNLKRITIKFWAIITFANLAISALDAQQEPPTITVDFSLYLWDSGPAYWSEEMLTEQTQTHTKKEAQWLYDNGQEIKLTRGNKTSYQRYTGPTPLVFYTEETDANGEIQKIPQLNVSINKGAKRVIIIVLPPNNQSSEFRAHTIDISPQTMPEGSVKVVNFSRNQLATKLSINNFALEPLGEKILTYEQTKADDRRFRVAINRDEKWKVVYSSSLKIRPDERGLIVIYPQGKRWRRIFLRDI